MIEPVYKALGKRIRHARNEANMTQKQLAIEAGLTESHVSLIESGRRRVALNDLQKIADALDVSVFDLLKGIVN